MFFFSSKKKSEQNNFKNNDLQTLKKFAYKLSNLLMFFTQSRFKNTLHLLHVRDIEIQMMQQSRKNHQKTNQANNISIIQIIHSVLNKKVLEQNMLK